MSEGGRQPHAVRTIADMARLDFDKQGGLLPAIVTDPLGAVLMLGYMDRMALAETLRRGRVVFYSRTRRELWEKGMTSGHSLIPLGIYADCDCDTLLVQARPRGPACHLGTRDCFGGHASPLAILADLEALISERRAVPLEGSYTTRLFLEGTRRIAQKVGEEGLEVALAAVAEDPERLVAESADLLYHLLVLLKDRGLGLAEVAAELRRRAAPDERAPP